jgi:hypothetical protein
VRKLLGLHTLGIPNMKNVNRMVSGLQNQVNWNQQHMMESIEKICRSQ